MADQREAQCVLPFFHRRKVFAFLPEHYLPPDRPASIRTLGRKRLKLRCWLASLIVWRVLPSECRTGRLCKHKRSFRRDRAVTRTRRFANLFQTVSIPTVL